MPDLVDGPQPCSDSLADKELSSAGEPTRSTRRGVPRRGTAVIVVVAAVAAVVTAVALVDTDETTNTSVADTEGATTTVGSSPTTSTASSAVATVDLERAAWRELPTGLATTNELSPVVVAIDQDRVVVLHLQNQGNDHLAGEILDLAAGTASPIAPSELEWRGLPLVGWTGHELIVAGGSNGPGIDHAGAAYDPTSDMWRDIADPPGFVPGLSENHVVGPGVWTGTELISWQSRLAYAPATDTWRHVSAPPASTQRIDEAVVATEAGILVWGGCDNDESSSRGNCDDAATAAIADGMIYDPTADTWRTVPAGPLGGGVGTVGIATSATGVLLVVPEPAHPGTPSIGLLDLATGDWTMFDDPPERLGRNSSLVWTGTHALLWGGYIGDSGSSETSDRGWALEPGSGQWTPLAAGGGGRRSHAAAWTPHGMVIAGGYPPAAPFLLTVGPDD